MSGSYHGNLVLMVSCVAKEFAQVKALKDGWTVEDGHVSWFAHNLAFVQLARAIQGV